MYAEEFFKKVHKGFSLAQEEIAHALLFVESRIIQCNISVKEANREKNKEKLKRNKEEIINLKYHERVFRKFADSIAWQLLHLQLHVIRRLYKTFNIKPISSSNLKSGLDFVSLYNKKYPQSFALLSDITSFIQIGDVLILDSNLKRIGILELKEGEKNEEMLNFLEDLKDDDKCKRKAIFDFLKGKNDQEVKQFKRILKQNIRNLSTISTINKGHGKDFDTGVNVIISDGEFKFKYFNEKILQLLKTTNKEFSATDIVDNCLLVGIYRSELFGYNSLKMWGDLRGIDYPVINFRHSFYAPCVSPPFLIGIGEENTLDLLLLKKHLFFCLDFDTWFRLADTIGIDAKWLSKKKTMQIIQKREIPQKLYTFKERAIEFTNGKDSLILEEGILARIYFELVSPMSALKFIKMYLEWLPDLKKITYNNV